MDSRRFLSSGTMTEEVDMVGRERSRKSGVTGRALYLADFGNKKTRSVTSCDSLTYRMIIRLINEVRETKQNLSEQSESPSKLLPSIMSNLWQKTPLIKSSYISETLNCSAYLKLEVRFDFDSLLAVENRTFIVRSEPPSTSLLQISGNITLYKAVYRGTWLQCACRHCIRRECWTCCCVCCERPPSPMYRLSPRRCSAKDYRPIEKAERKCGRGRQVLPSGPRKGERSSSERDQRVSTAYFPC